MRYILLIIIVFMSLSACSRSDKTDIGFMGTLSGRYSDLGQAVLQGVTLALENVSGGERVNLVVKDDFGKPAEALKALDELQKAGVSYIIGPNLSSVATAVAPHLESKNMYMLSPSASTSELAGLKDNFMRIMPHNNYHQAQVISKYLIDKLGIGSIVVIYDARNASYSNDIVNKFTEAFMKSGGKVQDVRPFNPDSGESMYSLIEKDRQNPPQMYYVIGSSMDTSLIIWQIKKAGLNSKILIRKWAASTDFYRLGGEAVEGVMLFDFYIDSTMNAYKKFDELYRKKYKKEPSWMSVYGYEAAKVMIGALDDLKNGSEFAPALQASASDMNILKNFEFDEYGDAKLPLHFFEITGGETKYKGLAE